MSLPTEQFVIPQGSTILITGANGFIASHIADQFLNLGYKVRGTTRNLAKNAWLTNLCTKKYGPERFELVSVPDMTTPDAFLAAVKGVSAVIHAASIFTLDPNPNNVIPGSIAGTVNALEAAAQEPSVKRFVLTSSSNAALFSKPNHPVTITVDSWNDEAVELAYREPPYEPARALPVYAASKVLSEKEAWKFVAERKPGFILNAVLPNINYGASLDVVNQGHPSTSGLVSALFRGDTKFLGGITPQYFVDVQDTALLHVAAAIHPGVTSERIFAFAEPVNADRVLAILRSLYPGRTFPADFDANEDVSEIVPRQRAEALLRSMGQDGWTSLEESVRRNTEDLA
ncbi:NAD(P)-binding protein [Aspergillus karnatakaensis]|uniref:NAD(P)-binding protein n=1 Tax=Aspergillus karnatakaensis TaxID=1810916 RepID=UPI003CCC9928